MKTLITPARVAEIAFEPAEAFCEAAVSEAAILSAQHKFIEPALGALYGELAEGKHAGLLEEYITPPLALYVKWLLMPSLAVQSGRMGIVQVQSASFRPADARTLARARQRVKADARALMRCAVEHIEQNPQLYPSYDGGTAAKAGTAGGVVL